MKRLYYSLSEFLKSKFGEKVKKIPIDAGLTCPTRDGTKGFGGCIYCDPKGSGTGLFKKGLSVEQQVELFLEKFRKRKFKKFIAYFQSFCNTYAPIEVLDKLYSVVYKDPSIVGLAIGTRPDCIDEDVIKLLKKYQSQGYFLWIELGLQSIHNKTLELINRGHTFEDFLKAYYMLKENDIPVVVHIIFGLPEENKEMMLATVKKLAELKIDGIKFHALYIVKGSKMEKLYKKGKYKPLELDFYVNLVAESLCYLPPTTVIHRLTSEARPEEIVAPLWVSKKHEVVNLIRKTMEEKGFYQGKFYKN
ncbi:TIGR01212 family radical SAM protein [Candidatus Pacearchaeota archaeon]|nr:MAG: TIGR01212 family radical SAM protein [Candidatus Pacearchaeota archaeon]